MSEHTPLPWHIPCPEDVYWVMDKDKHPVCCFSFQGDGKERHLANAKFIVEACNSHAKLIADNKRLREALNDIAKGMIPKIPPLNDVLEFRTQMWNWSLKRANQAINESE